jgi:hypothetical protein
MEAGLISQPPVADTAPRLQRAYRAFGEVGAAAVPLGLALATAAIEYDSAMARFLGAVSPAEVVLETGRHPCCGAIRLEPLPTEARRKQTNNRR